MKAADQGQAPALDGNGLKIAIVRARFNAPITEALEKSCIDTLHALGVRPRDIDTYTVPGALEVAQVLNLLGENGDHDALVALGCVIRGETYHFELVANESGAAVTRVALDHRVPIANAILTVENEAQAWARASDKGADAARVAVEMAQLMGDLS